jgi:ParB/RepB/Spo0J family partition protein
VKSNKPKPEPAPPGTRLMDIPLSQIIEPEIPARAQMSDQKMAELCDSMKAIGLVEPITVEQHDAMFEIITGHRRFLAARQLRWEMIRAVIYAEGTPNILAMRLHENIIREDLNPAEEALYMAQAREKYELDEEGLMRFFHCSQGYLASRFALLRGDPEIFKALQAGEIRVGAAGELNRITDEGMRRYYLDICRRGDHPQRVVHQWVQDWILQSCPPLPGIVNPTGGRADDHSEGNAAADSSGVPSVPAGFVPPPPAPAIACQLCGGDRDPYNLVSVLIHKWEWQEIVKQVEKAAAAQVGSR